MLGLNPTVVTPAETGESATAKGGKGILDMQYNKLASAISWEHTH